MVGQIVLGAVAGVASLGGILATVLGPAKERFWVVWIRGRGALVGVPVSNMDAAKAYQQKVSASSGRSSVIVTRSAEGEFRIMNPVRPTLPEKVEAVAAQIKRREQQGRPVPPGLLRRQAKLVNKLQRGNEAVAAGGGRWRRGWGHGRPF